jgi:ubiquitin-activating enzyme E1
VWCVWFVWRQFYLTEADVGRPRAAATVPRLAELNPYVPVHAVTGALTEDVLRQYAVVVATQQPLAEQLRLDGLCRAHGVHFIAAETRGVFGSIFNDFGQAFTVVDTNGEPPATCLIAGITSVRALTQSD